jgi:hypothetical protein
LLFEIGDMSMNDPEHPNDELKRLESARYLFDELLLDKEEYPPDVRKQLERDKVECDEKIAVLKSSHKRSYPAELNKKETDQSLKNYIVYLSNEKEFGSERYPVTREEIYSTYLSDESLFDIIIFNQAVKKKVTKTNIAFQIINLDGIPYKLLILLIKYRGIPLSYVDLYKKGWEGSRDVDEDRTTSGQVKETLSTAMTELRKTLGHVENFKIPRAVNESYKCEGDFKYCLILSKSIENQYILEGV